MDMTQAARDAKNAYMREWYKKNRDKARASQERYWKRKAEQQKRAQGAGERDN